MYMMPFTARARLPYKIEPYTAFFVQMLSQGKRERTFKHPERYQVSS
jgi:hypothetical protein